MQVILEVNKHQKVNTYQDLNEIPNPKNTQSNRNDSSTRRIIPEQNRSKQNKPRHEHFTIVPDQMNVMDI